MMQRIARSIAHPSGSRPRFRALVAISLALCAGAAHAASVRGTFVGGNPAAPLDGVEIVLRRAADSTVVAHTVTGADGHFRLDSLRFEHYLLRASLVGYQPSRRSDVVLSEAAPDRNIYLTRDLPSATTGSATDVLRGVPELDVDIDGHVSLRGSSSVNIQF